MLKSGVSALAIAAGAVVAMSGSAFGAVTAGVFAGGDAGFNALTENGSLERAVVESRIGNAATSGTWETAIWDQGASGTIQSQAQRNITNAVSESFVLTWDGVGLVSFEIGGTTVSWDAVPGGFTDIFIRARATENSQASLTDLDLVGSGTFIPSLIVSDGVDYLRIENMGADFGAFTLTGVQEFSWEGTRPNNSALAFQFKLTNVIPAPSALAGFGVLGLAALRRRR